MFDPEVLAHPLALVPERTLAQRWGKSVRSLQRWRNTKIGPPWLRIGATVFYRVADIHAFEEERRFAGRPGT